MNIGDLTDRNFILTLPQKILSARPFDSIINIIKLLLEQSEQALIALARKYERLCHRIA